MTDQPASMLRQVEFEDEELPNLLRHKIVRAVYEALPLDENGSILACNGEYVAAVAAAAALYHLADPDGERVISSPNDLGLGLRLRAASIHADMAIIENVEGERWNANGGEFDH